MVALNTLLTPYHADTGDERLPQRAYLAVRRAIRDLRLPPGQMVLEAEVAEALGMSRTPVREALVRLEAEGLVQLVPRHGCAVSPLLPDVLGEIYEIVEGLEGMAVALATTHVQPEAFVAFETLLAEGEDALRRDDLLAWVEVDDRFHTRLVEASGNGRLARLWETYHVQLYRARLYTIRLRSKPTRSNAEHRAVIAVIAAGDAGAARALHQAHRARARDEILAVLDAISSGGTVPYTARH